MAYPPLPVGDDFTDDTPAVGMHADRHNVTARAVNDVVAELGPNPKGTFEHVDDRLTGLEDGVDTLSNLVLPPDPGGPLSDLTSFTASSPIPDHVYFEWVESSDPSMVGGLGYYVIEADTSSSFTGPTSITVLKSPTFYPAMGMFMGSPLPPFYFRIKAVDRYGNESDWLDHGGGTPSSVTITPTGWDDLDASETLPATIIDAKGDLIAGTAADTPARLAVGTDGHVLTADSAQAAGVKWAAPSGGGGAAPIGPTFSTGKYAGWSGSIDTRITNEDRGFYVPMPIPRSLTVDRIGIEVTTSASGSPTIRLGIYEDDDGVPGDLLLDAGTVDASSPAFREITISQALTAGMVWLFCAQQGGSSNGAVRATRYATHVGIPSSGYTPYEAGAWTDADASPGAMSDPAPAMSDVASAAPRIVLRVA